MKKRADGLRAETYALYLAYRDPRVPWYAKVLAIAVVGYALSPIDLIPDFIPVLGYLDDLVIVPLGMAIAMRLIPKDVFEECRARAEKAISKGKKAGLIAALTVLVIWLLVAALVAFLILRAVNR
jgi:uncharacterized membrane protein YkvA (DUF1232 family)